MAVTVRPMSAMPCDFEADVDSIVAKPLPFATVYVTLTQQAHIELVTQAACWKSCHHRSKSKSLLRVARKPRMPGTIERSIIESPHLRAAAAIAGS